MPEPGDGAGQRGRLEASCSGRLGALVVDNNSSDATAGVVKDFSSRFPGRFLYLREPQPGKSYALNSGIREASGDILAFMDDDVVVEPTWLERLTNAFREREWKGAGGRILPQWSCTPPHWLPLEGRYSLAPLALFDLGSTAAELHEAPFGTNMAFRKEMFSKHGFFRTDSGRAQTAKSGARTPSLVTAC